MAEMKPAKEDPLLELEGLKVHFLLPGGMFLHRRSGVLKAVDGLSFSVRRGETLGLVGESGCGKSTTGLAILQLYRPTAGRVVFAGTDLCALDAKSMRQVRQRLQMVFQDPYASLNPRMTIEEIIGEPLDIHGLASGKARTERILELLHLVNLPSYFVYRYPHELSGGQRQRIGIARALAVEPEFIVCDEPVSALDVSIQAQIINLLDELQEKLRLTYLFISHDLSVVRHVSDHVAVMYLGKMMELARSKDLYKGARHPYSKALLSAVSIPDPHVEAKRKPIILSGDVPSPLNPPAGCCFHPRCPISTAECKDREPDLLEVEKDHWVACIKCLT
jgi:oligopeptide transport system ATP-binding protein